MFDRVSKSTMGWAALGEWGEGGRDHRGPWTSPVDRVYQNMLRVHGPPIFTTP